MNLSPEKNFYKVLGVEKNAKAKSIKKRYRELAKKYHPDANKGSSKAEETFKRISEAYEVLGDAMKRKAYDRLRANGAGTPRTQSRGRKGTWNNDFDYGRQYQRKGPREEPGGDPFGRTGFQEEQAVDPNWPTRGFDLQFMVDVPFALAALGGTLPYTYEKYVTCPDCQGSGLNTEEDPCEPCKGTQRVAEEVTLNVDIPSGVADQYTLRIANEGGCGRNGGPPGDLMVKVCITPHPRFKKLKKDIYAEIPISAELAEKGGPLEVESLDSVQTIHVEDGTLTGEEYRIPGQGSTDPWGKKRGDFVIKFLITDF